MGKETKTLEIDPNRQIRANKIDITPEDAKTLMDAVGRALKAKKPAQEDLDLIKKYLTARPDFCRAIFDAVGAVQVAIIKDMAGGRQDAIRLAAEEYILCIRDDMGYRDAPVMEQLLIENIVTCWLRLQDYEQKLTFRDANAVTIEFWDRRVTSAQRRYLAACESLAKVRKLKIPAVQVNIGEKQVNVAGNLQAPPKQKEDVIDA
jgi:hypothetical protein